MKSVSVQKLLVAAIVVFAVAALISRNSELSFSPAITKNSYKQAFGNSLSGSASCKVVNEVVYESGTSDYFDYTAYTTNVGTLIGFCNSVSGDAAEEDRFYDDSLFQAESRAERACNSKLDAVKQGIGACPAGCVTVPLAETECESASATVFTEWIGDSNAGYCRGHIVAAAVGSVSGGCAAILR